jgi:hypothetical protein
MANIVILILVTLTGATAAFLMWSAVKEESQSTGYRVTYIILSIILFMISIVPASFLKW